MRLAPLYCNCKSGCRNRLCLHLNELKARNFQISAGAVIRQIFRKDLILCSCWVAEVRSLLISYFISCCVKRCSFLLKQHFWLHKGWNTCAVDHVVTRHLLWLPESGLLWGYRRSTSSFVAVHGCAAHVRLKASAQNLPWRHVKAFQVHICSSFTSSWTCTWLETNKDPPLTPLHVGWLAVLSLAIFVGSQWGIWNSGQ